MIDIGQGNALAGHQVLVVIKPGTSSGKRLRNLARQENRLVDATGGKLTRSLVVTVSNHIILSNQEPEELILRLNEYFGSEP
jgi:regulator of extracellular matrix RemA (YlzA/DUF370 family)